MQKPTEPLTKKGLQSELKKLIKLLITSVSQRLQRNYKSITKDFHESIKPIKKLIRIVEILSQRIKLLEEEMTETQFKHKTLEKRLEKLERLQRLN